MKVTARDAIATRQSLMDAGTALFAERGFDGAKVDAIARRAGVNKAMISYHFGGKRGLYNAILADDFGWVLGKLAELDREPLPADVKLARFISIFGSLHTRRPGLSSMMLREAMSAGRHLDPSLLPSLSRIFASVQSIVAQGIAEKVFREVDPLFMHHTVLGTLSFFFAVRPLRDRLIAEGVVPVRTPDPARFIAHVQELLARGLSKEA
ncbi:MAG TPA: TetR/AcrR family transcriptional regulator [Candidatus Polarisedimenticolaceae bacterium]|nr:TetR/AcrR family transcriptional regulator [Candidatus Polarisedimenticolaceae bacterium]